MHLCLLITNIFVYSFTIQTLRNHEDEGICVKVNVGVVKVNVGVDDVCEEPPSKKPKQNKVTLIHHMTSTCRDMITRTGAPSFSSKTSGISGKTINFGATYNKFMKKFTALVSIISTHPPISIESEDSGQDDDGDRNQDSNEVLEVYIDSVISTSHSGV